MKSKRGFKKFLFVCILIAAMIVCASVFTMMSLADSKDSKGNEYDFSDKENNQKYDVKDGGAKKDGYDLIWSDEFNGNYETNNIDENTGLNLDNWSYQLGDGTIDSDNPGWGNKELQSYSNRKKNISVNEDLDGDGNNDGLLRITASYEENGFTQYDKESKKDYSSARIRTTKNEKELFNTTYGYIEARISTPATKGAWPAFWMLPQSTDIYGNWPVSGEIDVLETCGAFSDGTHDQAIGTLHWGAPEHMQKSCGYVTLNSPYTYFHKYAVDWQPGKITWFYDDKEIYSITSWGSKFANASDELGFDAPFDQPYFMLLNMAVDSGVFGKDANIAKFKDDINMYVDYVRCFQKTDGYPTVARKAQQGDSNDDWQSLAGQNYITPISSEALCDDLPNGDVATAESKGKIDNSKWYLGYQEESKDATLSEKVVDGQKYAKVGINTPGTLDYSIQLIGHYDAKAGYAYKVSFDGFADGDMVGKSIAVSSKEWRGWSSFGGADFTLTDKPTNYSYILKQTEDFDKLRYEFNFGNRGTGNAYIGNVKVEIVDPSLVQITKKEHTMLNDGNIVYNGTFDQGQEHIEYWKTDANTTLEVPRYTTSDLTGKDVKVVDVASKTNYEKLEDGLKYYERRAQITSNNNNATIYQPDMKIKAGTYEISMDVYSNEDTDIIASVNTSKDEEGEEVPDAQIAKVNVTKQGNKGVEKITMNLDVPKDIDNGVFMLAFNKDVQIDNISMIHSGDKIVANPYPMNNETTWSAEDGQGKTFDVIKDGNVTSVSGLTSGAEWWQSQVIGSDFTLIEGKEYKLSFKYKMQGESNNKFEYIVQENGNNWHVYNDGPTMVEYDSTKADSEGYCTYETSFVADQTIKNVHVVFGFGHSEASGNLEFKFKDASLRLADAKDISDDNTDVNKDDDNQDVNKDDNTDVVKDDDNQDVNKDDNQDTIKDNNQSMNNDNNSTIKDDKTNNNSNINVTKDEANGTVSNVANDNNNQPTKSKTLDKVPNTGDNTPVVMVSILGVISLAGIVGILLKKKFAK